MAEERAPRHLAAILAADVVGYSRLMEQDEAGTFERLRTHRKELLEPEIAKHQGRIFKLMGDGLLAEFGSVVDAVECAVTLQRAMAERNAGITKERRIDIRIGINLGDVIVEDEDRHGDGVNIAARLQQLADPGGIAVSRTVVDHVKHKLALAFESLGEHRLKNITEPVGAFRLADRASAGERRTAMRPSRRRAGLVAAAVLLLTAGAGAAFWYLDARYQQPTHRLSLVVLPFTNLSNDPEQGYFADAITNDLTTDLSRIEDSFVIAPNTARAYKGKNLGAKQIGRELNVRYILDGSLRRTENQVRINAQLIDTETEAAIWSDRFDGDWTKSMQLQDEITGRLARRLDLELTNAESRRAESEHPNNPDTVDLAMRGWSVLNQPYSRERMAQARTLFEQALHIDPELPKALVGLAQILAIEVNYKWSSAPPEWLARADAAITRVLSASPNDATAHFVKGEILRGGGKDLESAIREYETAISLNPSLAPAYASLGNAKIRAGRAEEAFSPLETAIRLSPRDPLLNIWYFNICHAYTHLGQDDEAIEWCRRSVAVSPFWIAYVDLASAYAWTGRAAEAHAAVAELLKLSPNYTVDRWAHAGFSNNPVFMTQYQRIIEGLRKAGLPEK
ncbi:MAG TPA: tetratricopeptide repeat protein [Dongiaceae bacterium]|jgi:class 3 adenylate cyclase/TolB-like protein/Tfp pilus assembly protein PilF|nr:tetratricopeptide repeat protein [Dongiaceae bacterium]